MSNMGSSVTSGLGDRGRGVKASSSRNCDLCSPRPRIFITTENIQAFKVAVP